MAADPFKTIATRGGLCGAWHHHRPNLGCLDGPQLSRQPTSRPLPPRFLGHTATHRLAMHVLPNSTMTRQSPLSKRRALARYRQSGLSLVELMIAMVIGLGVIGAG